MNRDEVILAFKTFLREEFEKPGNLNDRRDRNRSYKDWFHDQKCHLKEKNIPLLLRDDGALEEAILEDMGIAALGQAFNPIPGGRDAVRAAIRNSDFLNAARAYIQHPDSVKLFGAMTECFQGLVQAGSVVIINRFAGYCSSRITSVPNIPDFAKAYRVLMDDWSRGIGPNWWFEANMRLTERWDPIFTEVYSEVFGRNEVENDIALDVRVARNVFLWYMASRFEDIVRESRGNRRRQAREIKAPRQLLKLEIENTKVEIQDGEYEWCEDIGELVVPGSVRIIGRSAFERCQNLKKVYIREGVREIGGKAFKSCVSLTDVYLPATITTIGTWALHSENNSSFCPTLIHIPNELPQNSILRTPNALWGCTNVVYDYSS